MQKSVMRMAGLIENVLDFARGRLGGGINLTLSAQPLEPTLQQVVDELQSAHPESIIKTTLALTKPVMADPVRIGQLFSNLLGNALTYGTEGEPVTVIAKTEEQFELAVHNKGTPIPPVAMERLFSPYLAGRGAAEPAGLRSWPLHCFRDRQGAWRHNRCNVDLRVDLLYAEDATPALSMLSAGLMCAEGRIG